MPSSSLLSKARAVRNRQRMHKGLTAGTMALTGLQGMAACSGGESSEPSEPGSDEPTSPNVPVPGVDSSKSDWAQYEGERRSDMVQYRSEVWSKYVDCTSRGGCSTLEVLMKLYVQRVDGANLDQKRVGIVFRQPGWAADRTETALAKYFAANGDTEEWHVQLRLRSWADVWQPLILTAWYQDGLGHTYYDDNAGEFHVANLSGVAVVSQCWWETQDENGPAKTKLSLTPSGVTGKIGLFVTDLDFDKQVDLVWTTDGWATNHVFSLGEGGENKWYWVRDWGSCCDHFQMDVNIPGDFQEFQYAVVYRHGVVNGAKPYEFWDNNGGYNWHVRR